MERARLAVGSRVTVPNASVRIWFSRTPSPRRVAFTASIMGGGPQTCTRRAVMSSTDVSRGDIDVSAPASPCLTSRLAHRHQDVQIGIPCLQFRDLVTKDEIARRPEAQNEGHFPGP